MLFSFYWAVFKVQYTAVTNNAIQAGTAALLACYNVRSTEGWDGLEMSDYY